MAKMLGQELVTQVEHEEAKHIIIDRIEAHRLEIEKFTKQSQMAFRFSLVALGISLIGIGLRLYSLL